MVAQPVERGLDAVIEAVPLGLQVGDRICLDHARFRVPQRAAAWLGGAILASAALACVPGPVTWPLPTGLGGVFGDMILRFPALFTGAYPTGMFATVIGSIIALPAVWLMVFSAGLIGGGAIDDEFIATSIATCCPRPIRWRAKSAARMVM